MKIYADLHIHSFLSRATSPRMTIPEVTHYSRMKGLSMLGTGDALHPAWMKQLRKELDDLPGTNLYQPRIRGEGIYFITQVEVATIHRYEGKARRIHHVILMPSFEVAEELSAALSRRGNMRADGRPTLNMTPAELVETTMEIDSRNFVFPAHAWTSTRCVADQRPWWSIFGAIGGVDTMEECYEDQVKHIHALETGLIGSLAQGCEPRSDPRMNWRVSRLDKYALISSSDAHSAYPFRLGREAVVLSLERVTFSEVTDAIEKKDPRRLLMTIEVPPAYGKGVSLPWLARLRHITGRGTEDAA